MVAEIAGETDAVLQIDEDGTYEVEVDNNGCVTTESIDVNLVDYTVDLGPDEVLVQMLEHLIVLK